MRTRRDRAADDPDDARCRICGRLVPLSFEHVPPRAAGNADAAWMYGLESWLNREGGKPAGRAEIQQGGAGAYSLCRVCNEHAGARYVPDFLQWTAFGMHVLRNLVPSLPELDQTAQPAHVTVTFEQLRPARFLKQVVTMLLAITPGGFPPVHPDLVAFAQDPERIGLPSPYQLYLSLFGGPMARYNGGTARIREDGQGGFVNDFVIELAHPPFAYVLSFDEKLPAVPTGCISNFADLTIHQRADVELPLLVGFGHTALPLDYRSKAELELEREQNRAEDG